MTSMMTSSITTELWMEQNILIPGQVCGDVINVLDDISLTRCAVYCLTQVFMCFMFEFNAMTKVCRLYSGIAYMDATHLSSWNPFVAYKGPSNCERSGYAHAMDEGLCFKVFEKELTWHDARTTCEKDKGRLAVLRNPRQTEMLLNFDQGNSSMTFWIGLTDPDQDGNSWQWVDGTTFDSSVWHLIQFNGYSSSYPSDHNTADCAALNQRSNYLIDINCKSTFAFVCERPQLL